MKTALFQCGSFSFKAQKKSDREIYEFVGYKLIQAGLLTITTDSTELELNSHVKVVNHHPSRLSDFRLVMHRSGVLIGIDETWGEQCYVVRFTDDGPDGEWHFYRCELAPTQVT